MLVVKSIVRAMMNREDSDKNRDDMFDEITKKIEDKGGKRI